MLIRTADDVRCLNELDVYESVAWISIDYANASEEEEALSIPSGMINLWLAFRISVFSLLIAVLPPS